MSWQAELPGAARAHSHLSKHSARAFQDRHLSYANTAPCHRQGAQLVSHQARSMHKADHGVNDVLLVADHVRSSKECLCWQGELCAAEYPMRQGVPPSPPLEGPHAAVDGQHSARVLSSLDVVHICEACTLV